MDVELPKLADTLVEGTVARWLKQPGERVRRGEPLVEIETDKVNSELEAPADGILAEILVPAGETVPVGQVIARLDLEGAAAPAGPAAETPVGVHHAMTAAPDTAGGLSPMRRRIAERVQEARARIPQGACVRELDLSRIDRRGASWTACFAKALAAAAGIASVGIAVEVSPGPGAEAGEAGLLVPVLRNVRGSSLEEVGRQVADLAERARAGALQAGDMGGGEFTVTNVGGGGTLMAFPLVNPGEPGILAPGAIRDGRCYVTLCFDRRRYDDWAADRLLARVEEELGKL